MHKLPVGPTIRTAYQFLSVEMGTVIRLSWFPLLIAAVVQALATRASIDAMVANGAFMTPGGGSAPSTIWDLAAIVVMVIAYAMVAVAIHRIILFGDRRRGTYLLVSFGRAELLFMVIPVIVVIVVALIGSGGLGVAYLLGAFESQGANDALMFVPLAIFLVMGYFAVRLGLVYPIIVAENRFDIGQSWKLSAGNFWRLFWTYFLGSLPLLIVTLVLMFLLSMIILPMVMRSGLEATASVEQIAASVKDAIIYQAALSYLLTVISVALGVALLCFSYKALRGIGSNDLLPPPGG
jgi:hypothetical protein